MLTQSTFPDIANNLIDFIPAHPRDEATILIAAMVYALVFCGYKDFKVSGFAQQLTYHSALESAGRVFLRWREITAKDVGMFS